MATKRREERRANSHFVDLPDRTRLSTVKGVLQQRAGLKPQSFSLADAAKTLSVTLPSLDLPNSCETSSP